LASTAFASDAPKSAKPDLAAGEAKATQVCAACHAADGSRGAPTFPILQGQHADYTKTQLTSFRQGERNNSVQMSSIAANLSDKEIAALSDYIAGLR
jgi:cytochrome c553